MTAERLPPDRTPVIVGVGEVADRPVDPGAAREPAALMAEALRRAEDDAGAKLLARADSLDVINEISWPYADAPGLVSGMLGIAPVRQVYHPVGGQTPVLAIHEAALRIQSGQSAIAVICGAESEHSVRRAARDGVSLPWTPRLENFQPVRGASYQREIARQLNVATPTNVYPFYENATRVAWGQSFAEAQAESAMIWAGNARVAATREAAWIRTSPSAADILSSANGNRPIAWPYSKLMVANPTVNQGAAVIVTSLAQALAAGVAEARMIHIWGGAASDEPRDYLDRCGYATAPAMEAALQGAMAVLAANGRTAFDAVELYSCFPVVPKLARRTLGLAAEVPLSVTGGLTFFGAPLNNYMTHAAVAMVEALRAGGGAGLLFGQGEYVTKHHALVLGSEPGVGPVNADYRIGTGGPGGAAVPPCTLDYRGPASIETFTVLFGRDAEPLHGVVIARTPAGGRTMARVTSGIDLLLDTARAQIGAAGTITVAADGIPDWHHV